MSEVVPVDELRARARVLALRLAAKPPLAVQATVKAIWDGLHQSVAGRREMPLVYTQLTNPQTKVEMDAVVPPDFEVR